MATRRLTSTPWLATIAAAAVIAWLTLTPQPVPETGMEWPEGTDKVVHFVMFFALMAAAVRDWRLSGRRMTLTALTALAVGAALFGGIDELLQQNVVAGREGSAGDFIADIAGIAAAALIARRLKKKK